MHQEKYWASKVPLPMALLFLANILVILAVQILVFYRYPAAPEPASLAKYDPVYASSRILAEDSRNYLTASLVETILLPTRAEGSCTLSRWRSRHPKNRPCM